MCVSIYTDNGLLHVGTAVPGRCVDCSQPYIAQREKGVSISFSILKNLLKFFLPRSPLLFGEVKVTNEGPGISMVL